MKLPIKYYLAVTVSFLTFVIYLPSLYNGFLWWDDNLYVFENPNITSLNPDFFRWAFQDFYASNWHPLTWISHALDYAVWGLNPLGHHLTNSILHSLNTYLVVLLIINLMQLKQKNDSGPEKCAEYSGKNGTRVFPDNRTILIIAGTTGLLFGLHPLHVQSVAWISERKDLLCALFFLFSISMYIKYAGAVAVLSAVSSHEKGRGRERKSDSGRAGIAQLPGINSRIFHGYYLLCLLFFVLALLSKPMAVSLPLVLLILDWYPFKRILSLKTFAYALAEKAPFFAFSIASSLLTLMAQKAGGALSMNEDLTLSDKLIVAAGSLVAYIRKLIAPLDLKPYYSYPAEISISSLRYLLPIILIAGTTALVLAAAKRHKLWAAAWGYYLATLFPVLGIVQAGHQAMADRYMYLPSLGPFLLIGLLAGYLDRKVIVAKRSVPALAVCGLTAVMVIGGLCYLTVQQIALWKNDTVLWSYAIEKEPALALAYLNRGVAFEKAGNLDNAIADYNQVIALEPFEHYAAYFNRAHASYAKGLRDEALRDYSTAILLDPDYSGAYYNRGVIYFKEQDNDLAFLDFQKACHLGEQKACAALQLIPPR